MVKPNRCTIFRVYWISLYIFRTVFPSTIRSPGLYIQHHVYVIQVRWLLASGHEMERNSISCALASNHRTCMTYTWCSMYSLGFLMMNGETVPKYVEWYSTNSKNCASSWFYYRNISRCMVPWTPNLSRRVLPCPCMLSKATFLPSTLLFQIQIQPLYLQFM